MGRVSLADKYTGLLELARILGVTRETVRLWVKTGKLEAEFFRGQWMVEKKEAQRLIESRGKKTCE